MQDVTESKSFSSYFFRGIFLRILYGALGLAPMLYFFPELLDEKRYALNFAFVGYAIVCVLGGVADGISKRNIKSGL